jgi:hypothetical protein
VQQALMAELGLGQPEIAWHTERDRIAEVGCFLGLVTGTLAKLATDVKLMMATEVGEAFEPYAPGRGSSSTMPPRSATRSAALISMRAPPSSASTPPRCWTRWPPTTSARPARGRSSGSCCRRSSA